MVPDSIENTIKLLAQEDYVADRSLATAVFLSLKMKKPLFLEGEAGVGKTEIAKVLAKVLGAELIRLQCYEGLDMSSAAYEWNYPRQILEIRLQESSGHIKQNNVVEEEIFGDKFLIKRPLLRALEHNPTGHPPVLLIDELDRSDQPFEAFLLEILSDFQITIPEMGTVKANTPPTVVITSNRTREIHDAVKRRCLYHWVSYPDFAQELDILKRKIGDINNKLAEQIVEHVQVLRNENVFKKPGTAETLDWAKALQALSQTELSPSVIESTLGVLLKYQDDIDKILTSNK